MYHAEDSSYKYKDPTATETTTFVVALLRKILSAQGHRALQQLQTNIEWELGVATRGDGRGRAGSGDHAQ